MKAERERERGEERTNKKILSDDNLNLLLG